MLISYLRSSSYTAFDWCQFKYWLVYTLGLKEQSGWKSERGNMVHKALELLARRKLAEQEGKTGFLEPELCREFSVDDIDVESSARLGYEHYAKKNESKHDWGEKDYEDVLRWTRETVEFRGGLFDPRKRVVIAPELYFDLPIDKPWAKYSYISPHDGKKLEGALRIKGTMDLVTRVAPGIIELCDWKTGRRWDWGKDIEKTYERMCDDPQLLLYYYALSELYPDEQTIFVTIFFCQDGGPFTIVFEKKHRERALAKLRRRFEAIKHSQLPGRILGDASKRWKCERLCHFYKDKREDGQSQCDYLYQELVSLGMDRATAKHGRPGAAFQYGSGGGQSNREGTP